ncbi:MAG: cytochrome ubiquinol oxidase subunit I [Actinomycetales bacterium]|nr:cytochrome ubiquinol oxidase subunit I [Actinomycetales bacterium]
MSALDLARWQFGITTVYHFLFVPVTIGTGFLVAGLQTAWVRTGDLRYLRATKFFGKLFLINFAMGVVTGIVQEFQFGMNWSNYSRFVGDIFGAPLAIEGLLAFFLESTFLGVWIFGWDRLPRKVHLASIWLAATGTVLSAYFILAANSFMQHPVGFTYNATTGRAELTSIVTLLTQKTAVTAFFHTITSAFLVAGSLFVGVSAWLVAKGRSLDVMRTTLKVGLVTTFAASILVFVSGDMQARVMVQQQPMKMAAAEALYETQANAPFSVFTIGTLDGSKKVFQIGVPDLLSIISTGKPTGTVEGVNNLQAAYEKKYGIGDYKPNIPVAYWSFRLMIGFGALAGLYALWALWATRRNRIPRSRWFLRGAVAMPFLPIAGMGIGWIFTEMARQPWVVFGLMRTADGVSPNVSAGEVLTSMLVLTALYAVLAVVEFGLMFKAVKIGPPEVVHIPENPGALSDAPLTFSY